MLFMCKYIPVLYAGLFFVFYVKRLHSIYASEMWNSISVQ